MKNSIAELLVFISSFFFGQILNFSHNIVANFPPTLGKDQLITHIIANNNQLTAIPENLTVLRMLEELELDNNKLLFLPNALENLNGLRILKVAGNKLERFKIPSGTITHCDLSSEFKFMSF